MLQRSSAPPSAHPRSLSLAIALACSICAPRTHAQAPAQTAAAAEQTIRGTILQIDGDDIVIDLGKSRIDAAQSLSVYRAIEVRHPITHRALRDRFVIGSLAVVQAGETLSVAKANAPPTHPFAVGDSVESAARVVAGEAAGPAAATGTATTTATSTNTGNAAKPAAGSGAAAGTTATPTNPSASGSEERALGAAWIETLAKPPEARAEIYAGILLRYPKSRFRESLLKEIAYLRTFAREARSLRARDANDANDVSANARAELALAVSFAPVHAAEAGKPIELAGRVRPAKLARSVTLYARALEEEAYVPYRAEIDARGHARVQLPKTIARTPGFAYFVEIVGSDGQTTTANGNAREPTIVVVRSQKSIPSMAGPRTSVRFSSELVSFDGTSGRDYFLLNEGDFLYRLRYGAFYGLRVGYGSYNGEGGTVKELDEQGIAPRSAGFSYGFVETEFELDRLFGIALRGTVGLGRPHDLETQRKGLTGGFQLRARIGAADATHLVIAGELMPEIGQRAYLGLRFAPIKWLPMATEVVVTDQPVNSDELAVRLIYEIGYRLTDRIALALRPSYQLRTIAHAGPGIGIAASFDW